MSISSLFSYGWEILAIIGALGFFIYGMKVMSDGIQKVAGDQLRNVLKTMTSNRFSGLFTGFVTTSLVQSSSATTVMVVSFVNAGLLKLREAIGVIMGANIGTTITGLIITLFGFSKFSLADSALPILAIGLPMMFAKKDKVRYLGEFIIGFCLLFMGLDALKSTVPDLKDEGMIQQFTDTITYLSSFGFGSVILFIIVGTILTVIVQSSSAAMAITLILCNKGLIPFEVAAAIILGENIGTTITANLAALIGNVHARRAARAHFIFNVFGVLWMLILFYPFLQAVDQLVQYLGQSILPQSATGETIGSPFTQTAAVTWGLTFFHVSFNICNTFLLIWFVPQIERIVVRFTKDKTGEVESEFTLRHIGADFGTPELSLLAAYREMTAFGTRLSTMLKMVRRLISEELTEPERIEILAQIEKDEDITDRLEDEIANYLMRTAEGQLSESAALQVRKMLTIVHEQERIGDILFQISRDRERMRAGDRALTANQLANLDKMLDLVEKGQLVSTGNIETDQNQLSIERALGIENDLNRLFAELDEAVITTIEQGETHVKAGLLYKELLASFEKIGNHQLNITETLLEMQVIDDD